MLRWTSLLFFLACACVATPQPDPPSLDPSRVGPSPRVDRESDEEVIGAPGAVEPGGADVWVSPIDRSDLPVQTMASAADGSFRVLVEQGRYRLQVRTPEQRSAPVDVSVGTRELLVIAPVNECLSVPLELEADGEVAVVLLNHCDQPVELAGASMRIAADFEVLEVPTRIAPGERAVVRVQFTPIAPGVREEILRIDVNAPIAERRAVTLFGR